MIKERELEEKYRHHNDKSKFKKTWKKVDYFFHIIFHPNEVPKRLFDT